MFRIVIIRGVQYMHCVMYKCIMAKVGGKRKNRKQVKARKFYEIRGKFAKVGGNENLSEIGRKWSERAKIGENNKFAVDD